MAGNLTLEQLEKEVAGGKIDTVVAAFTDLQGRLMGKRFHARYFVDGGHEETHGCDYLLATDIDMETVPGYSAASWKRGYGDFVLKPDLRTLCFIPWLPATALVLVPVGGGGLASGVGTAIKARRPEIRVVGVEPELAADARDSLAQGSIVHWSAADVSRTIADGTRTQSLGERTFAHMRAHIDAIVTVSEAEIAAGVRLAAEGARLVAEPSGALAIAAWAFRREELAGSDRVDGDVVAVVSGGNVDPAEYRRYLEAPLPG